MEKLIIKKINKTLDPVLKRLENWLALHPPQQSGDMVGPSRLALKDQLKG